MVIFLLVAMSVGLYTSLPGVVRLILVRSPCFKNAFHLGFINGKLFIRKLHLLLLYILSSRGSVIQRVYRSCKTVGEMGGCLVLLQKVDGANY